MLHDGDAGVLRTALFHGPGAEAYRDVEIPVDCGVAGMVFTQGRIQFVADAARDSRWFDPARVISSGLRSVLLLPLIAGTNRLGVLWVDSPRFGPAHPPSLGDVRQLEIFAAQAAVALVNARLYQTSQQVRARQPPEILVDVGFDELLHRAGDRDPVARPTSAARSLGK